MKEMKYLTAFGIAAAVAVPGIWVRLFHIEFAPPLMVLISGAAILGGSFLLLWACDAAQADISQTLALAVVALIAVLPEYAVDMYFTWQAGQNPASGYSHYAIANMTGANRLLIGVAWAMTAVICWLKTRGAVQLEEERRTELLFLGMATAYAFAIPLKGSLEWYDGIVFIGLYVWYIVLAGRRPCEECEPEGPSMLLIRLPKFERRLSTSILFIFSAAVILVNAEPFSEGLIATGRHYGINEFLLVQWLAPIASEAPEFIVAGMFAFRGQAGLALGSLLSAKLNQWTLLVGMIPGVYALSHKSFANPIPLDRFQLDEVLLTAAQSLPGRGARGRAEVEHHRRGAALRPLCGPVHRPRGHGAPFRRPARGPQRCPDSHGFFGGLHFAGRRHGGCESQAGPVPAAGSESREVRSAGCRVCALMTGPGRPLTGRFSGYNRWIFVLPPFAVSC